MLRRGVLITGAVALLLIGAGWASVGRSQWSPPQLLAAGTGDLAGPIAVEVGPSQSVAAWASAHGVFAAIAGTAGRFRAPQRLSAAGLRADLAEPLLATDARGDAIVIWQHPSPTVSPSSSLAGPLYAAYRPAGGRFGPAHLIARNARRASVGMDGRGAATIAWAEVDGPGQPRSIDVVQRASSGRYSPVGVLATGAVSLDGVAVNAVGDAVIVWDAGAPGSPSAGIMAATRERVGPFRAPVSIVAPSVGAIDASVGIDDAGDALIAWDGPYDGATEGLPYRFVQVTPLALGATMAGPAQTLRALGLGRLDGIPVIDVDGPGDAIVTWQNASRNGAIETLVAARRTAGHPFASARTIGRSYFGGNFVSAIGPHGAAIIAWDSASAPVKAVLAPSANKRFGHAVPVARPGEDSAAPAVAVGPHARAIAIWCDLQTSRLSYATAR